MTWKTHAKEVSGARLGRALIGAIFVALVAILAPSGAQACKDCPFPMKIGDNQWLMPDSHVVVGIYESEYGSDTYVTVELRDERSGDILASGSAVRTRKARSLELTLRDSRGRKVKAKIHWVSYENAVIQAKFDCGDGECAFFDR